VRSNPKRGTSPDQAAEHIQNLPPVPEYRKNQSMGVNLTNQTATFINGQSKNLEPYQNASSMIIKSGEFAMMDHLQNSIPRNKNVAPRSPERDQTVKK